MQQSTNTGDGVPNALSSVAITKSRLVPSGETEGRSLIANLRASRVFLAVIANSKNKETFAQKLQRWSRKRRDTAS